MDVSAYPRLIQVYLNILRASDFFIGPVVRADRDQAIAIVDLRTGSRRTGLNFVGDNSLFRVGPGDTVPRRSFTVEPLNKVQDARRQQ